VSRRRRGTLLVVLAAAFGSLAASDVHRRERALDGALGPTVGIVVTRAPIARGEPFDPGRLALRRLPARYAPAGAVRDPSQLAGLRAAVDLTRGADVTATSAQDAAAGTAGATLRAGERAASVVAVGDAEAVTPGAHVDVIVTREDGDRHAGSELALEDVEVLDAGPEAAGDAPVGQDGPPRVRATLRVSVRQAVFLAAAQSFAREIRLLVRAPSDRGRGGEGTAVGPGLG
jgi:pilus assembly protein CpaB